MQVLPPNFQQQISMSQVLKDYLKNLIAQNLQSYNSNVDADLYICVWEKKYREALQYPTQSCRSFFLHFCQPFGAVQGNNNTKGIF